MKFVYPDFLYALFAIAIPIIIHLFNFRRYKTIYFTNVRFLKNVQEETNSTNKLKHLLVLLSRILAIIFLVLAFAQPFILQSDKPIKLGSSIVGIYLDNSFSMQGQNENGSLIDIAKNKSLSILDAYKADDRFVLLTNDFEGKHQRALNKEDFIDFLQAVDLSPSVKTISEIQNRLNDIVKTDEAANKYLYFISDFQKTTANIDLLKNDSSIQLNLLPISSQETDNLFIDSCWFYSPYRQGNSPEKLVIKIVNHSDKKYENIPISIEINGKTKTPASFNIDANQTIYDTLSYTNSLKGIQLGKISIKDYPISFDDDFYFNYKLSEQISITVINENENSKPMQALFGTDDFFKLNQSSKNQIDFATFKSQQLIVLNGLSIISSGLIDELQKFVKAGGHLIIFPSLDNAENATNNLIQKFGIQITNKVTTPTKIDYLNSEAAIYQNVFEEIPKNLNLPLVNNYYPISTTAETLLRLQNRKDFLVRKSFQKGSVYLCATSLETEASNFSQHAIFVPTMYNIALNSQSQNQLFHWLNENNKVTLSIENNSESPLQIKGNGIDFIPEQRFVDGNIDLYLHSKISLAGNYTIFKADKEIEGLSLNYDRKESILDFYQKNEIKDLLLKAGLNQVNIMESNNEILSKEISENREGFSLWKYCIILCLLFIAFEVLLLRLFK